MAEKTYEVINGIRLPDGELRNSGTIKLEENDEDTKRFLSRDAIRLAAGQDESEVTPAASRKAQELGVDLSSIEGTGDGGKITVSDVEKAAGRG